MGIRINTNIAAINTRRNLTRSTMAFQKSMEKLSSGLRINRASDDAAGLAISEGLKSDIRALDQASRNAADGISMVQVGEGALDEVSNILLRMRELAEQSLNGTLSDTERIYLNQEYTDLMDEVDRISASADFNGIKLLDGSQTNPVSIQVGIGTGPNDSIAIDLSDALDAAGIGLGTGVGTSALAATAMDEVADAVDRVSSARASFGATQNRLETSIRNIQNTSENLSAANSRIRDVDVASETSNLTSLQILQQAAVSILSQANMTTSLALKLLQ
jgi:flagellin